MLVPSSRDRQDLLLVRDHLLLLRCAQQQLLLRWQCQLLLMGAPSLWRHQPRLRHAVGRRRQEMPKQQQPSSLGHSLWRRLLHQHLRMGKLLGCRQAKQQHRRALPKACGQ